MNLIERFDEQSVLTGIASPYRRFHGFFIKLCLLNQTSIKTARRAVKIESEENDMKEMIYTDKRERIVLDSGTKDGYEWCILSLGSHPCAYVKIPNSHPRYKYDADDYNKFDDIVCHGGITYVYYCLDTGDGETNHGHWVGWDYAHARDYSGYLDNAELNKLCNAKKWTTSEIRKEVFDVINQLKKMEVSA